MAKVFSYAEVSQHNTPESCWVILYGCVYDVTSFLPEHPGGIKAILNLAGQDATSEYDPIHPSNLLKESLKRGDVKKLGTLDASTVPSPTSPSNTSASPTPSKPNLQHLLNLDEIASTALQLLSPKAKAYYHSASDDLYSKTLNSTVYSRILLRPRIFLDCTTCTTATTFLGHKVHLPIFVSPAALARLGHPSGERGIAEACNTFNAMQIISHNASQSPEEIVRDMPESMVFGWQLYVQNDRKKSEAMLARIRHLKQVKFICLTLDAPVPGKREEDERFGNIGAGAPVPSGIQAAKGTAKVSETSASPTTTGVSSPPPKKSNDSTAGPGAGVGRSLFWGTAADLTWRTTLPWLAQHAPKLPIVLKGIQTHEDAYLASLHAPQVRAIILSNHGGRALDTAPPAIHTLLEIRKYCPEVFDRVEVWVDGGVRRGTDVVKALCLGARGVGVGRAALYGLAVGGSEGVERVLEILKAETETCMRLLGVKNVDELGMQHINARAVERDIYDGPDNLAKATLSIGRPKL
ncbi:mitochondrial cytochrome-like protein b2 [Westerdykella ornata]|uniref:L-lactate dehydrogenase (cytochrome) n=1 Tax=Westerdykella ornata TaxID=318751 RepID=A0A6A6J6Y3_WESOR|nr:mitochondrial cytochrome-like protein b2 [Westerdykella ornata]KAF2271913.1 mitochondrial cytochrome-like protein b2 [Westerdykella ornata]